MLLTLFVGCGKNEALESAKAYLENMYQTGSKDEPMNIMVDKEVLTVVTVDGKSYDVEWSVEVTEGDKEAVKVSESDKENTAIIDIPDLPETDILFTAIATIKDKKKSIEAKFDFKVMGLNVAGGDAETILNDAYALKEGAKMDAPSTLTGKITKIDTPYSAQYKNITVTMVVEGFDDKPIQCYRLKGNGADKLAVGDTITVTGTIINYKGKVQFDAGSEINTIVKADGTTTNNPTTNNNNNNSNNNNNNNNNSNNNNNNNNNNNGGSLTLVTDTAKILNDAFKLGRNETTPYIAQLTGKVISIDKAYSEQYSSVSVTMQVEGKNIKCWNMKGTETNKVKVGDTITCRGVIKNFFYDNEDTTGDVEFTWDDASQVEVTLVKYEAGKVVEKTLSVVDNPVVGTAYKFGFVSTSATKGGTYYAVGGMTGYYMSTTTSASAAIDVYLENANGGYYLYTNYSGKKQYLTMESTGSHVNAIYSDSPSIVFAYDTTNKTLVSTTELAKNGASEKYVFGTYGNYFTIGASGASHDDTYYCRFYQ